MARRHNRRRRRRGSLGPLLRILSVLLTAAAIVAALYPDEEMLDDGYLYFCLAEPDTGKLVFAKTLEEHNANVAKYKELWEEADRLNEN